MKICKNNTNIILYPVTQCSNCDLRVRVSPCIWFKVVGNNSINCGGIRIDSLSDIFKL